MNDFFYIFAISISIICILRCFYDIILMRNKFKNCNVKIYIKYKDENEAFVLKQTLKHVSHKYLIDADVIFETE